MGRCSSAAHHHLGCLVIQETCHKDSMDERSSLCPAQQNDTSQRATQMHEELTERMEMKGDSYTESQLSS